MQRCFVRVNACMIPPNSELSNPLRGFRASLPTDQTEIKFGLAWVSLPAWASDQNSEREAHELAL